jgi:murein DD-endopeptidase MepM/ murein hydrolase activator NlpD
MGSRLFLTVALVSTVAAAAPARAAAPAPAWSWSWNEAWSRCADIAATTRALAVEVPAQIESFGAELQVRWRDAMHRADELLAQLLPVPSLPDLSALAASPVPGVESSGFGWRRDPIHHHDKFHRGTDFRAKRGTPVYAAGAGIVAFTGRQHGYGNVIYIDHGGGLVTRYAHLSRIEVKAGTPIDAAGRIGQVGATGRTTGPHLHFEVRLDGRAVDPTLAMQVATLERTDPPAAWLAARGLAADVQESSIDQHDPPRHTRLASNRAVRPERRGAPTRSRALW